MENKNEIFGKRLKHLRNSIGKNQEDIANALGISRARYSHYENNHVEPDIDLIRRIADFYQVDTDYLLGRQDYPSSRKSDYPIGTINGEFEGSKITGYMIPLLGYIAAGQPILAQEHIEDYTYVPASPKYRPEELIMFRVKGDSMIGSRIFDGDKVLVKLQPDVENGEIAVVNINGYEATVKKVKKLQNGQILLMPSNDKYDPILVENENARIIGKVIQVIFEPK